MKSHMIKKEDVIKQTRTKRGFETVRLWFGFATTNCKFGCLNWGSNFEVLVNGRSILVHHFNDASVEIFTKYETFQSHDDESN